jgi:Helicase HerA, central domain
MMSDTNIPPIKHITLPYQIGTTVQRMKLTAGTALTVLGIDLITGEEITIEDKMRQSGMYVVGRQGMGKSSFLESLIFQDICKGYAVIVIDPHGDLVDHVEAQLPESRVQDVRILDVTNTKYPFALNIFHCRNLNNAKVRGATRNRVMHVFERLWPGVGDRVLFAKLLPCVAEVLIENPEMTMADIQRLLRDRSYRDEKVKHVRNNEVVKFWKYDYNTKPASKQGGETQVLDNRLHDFLIDEVLKNIVCQSGRTIDIRQAIEDRKILLVKLPIIDEDFEHAAPIVGIMLMSLIHAATFSFRDTPLALRPGFSLYVDEVQNFTTVDFEKLFTQGRKFGTRQTIANQFTKQISLDNLREAAMNADTVVAFRTTQDDSRNFSHIFSDLDLHPEVQRIYRDVFPRLKNHAADAVTNFWARYIKRWEEADGKSVKTRRTGGYEYSEWPEWNLGFRIVEYHPHQVRAALSILEDLFFETMRRKTIDDELSGNLLAIARSWFDDDELEQFTNDLSTTLTALMHDPIGERKQTDIADTLHHLERQTALVRVGTTSYSMKTKETPPFVSADELHRRRGIIKYNTIREYCQKRGQIEKALQNNQTTWQVTTDEEADNKNWGEVEDRNKGNERKEWPRFEEVEDE